MQYTCCLPSSCECSCSLHLHSQDSTYCLLLPLVSSPSADVASVVSPLLCTSGPHLAPVQCALHDFSTPPHPSPITFLLFLRWSLPQSHAEEINIIQPGHNYLWRNFEGNSSFTSPYTPPVANMPEADMVGTKAWPLFEYLHMCSPDSKAGVECVESDYVAVIGGVVYRSALRNKCLQVCVSAT